MHVAKSLHPYKKILLIYTVCT